MQLSEMAQTEISDAAGTLATTAYVFLCQPELITEPALLMRYEALLDVTERSRLARFHNARDARTFLIAHALVRTTLSQFADTHPHEWRFRTNEFGRPEIAGPAGAGTLRFNLSHCDSLIVCLVAAGVEPGVDVEEICGADDLLELADRYFSPSEVAALRSCPSDTTDRFFALWTLKEAYIKARGMGVAIPLDKFSFSFCNERVAIRFDPELADQADDWTFTLERPLPSHFVAIALRHVPTGTQRRLIFRRIVPLIGLGTALPRCLIASSTPIAATADRRLRKSEATLRS